MTTPSRKRVSRSEVSPSPYFPGKARRSRTEPATDPETHARHEQILRDAGLWDRAQQSDAEVEAILDDYESEER